MGFKDGFNFIFSYVPRVRIGLTTQGFSVLCSTTELPRHRQFFVKNLLRESDSNRRPLGYGPSELPTALPRYNIHSAIRPLAEA